MKVSIYFHYLLVFLVSQTFFPGKIFPEKAYRKSEVFELAGCKFQFPEDSVVEKGEGTKEFYRIYPRTGDDFFYTIRAFPRIVPEEKKANLVFSDERISVAGNPLVLRTRYLEKGNLLLFLAVREEKQELMEFFLSCE